MHILIDSGSTHNFLDPKVAKGTGATIKPTGPLTVTVADDTRISNKAMVQNGQWDMQGTIFTAEMRLLPLGGCDMVLGFSGCQPLGQSCGISNSYKWSLLLLARGMCQKERNLSLGCKW